MIAPLRRIARPHALLAVVLIFAAAACSGSEEGQGMGTTSSTSEQGEGSSFSEVSTSPTATATSTGPVGPGASSTDSGTSASSEPGSSESSSSSSSEASTEIICDTWNAPSSFDYSCDGSDSDSCPAGLCVFGRCIAPEVDDGRWADCGDGVCDPCRPFEECPADCTEDPLVPERDLANPNSLTVYVHGFRNAGDQDSAVWGEARRAGSLGSTMLPFLDGVVDGVDNPEAARQLVGVGYYGTNAGPQFTPEDIEEIEAIDISDPEVLHRYALIVARFITRRLETSDAETVNMACHSMGCHITRYMIEHDLDGHASSGRIVRWFSSGGVIAGARLARLYDNPDVQSVGGLIGINTVDFIHMNPDYVRAESAIWDRRIHEGNNPNFGGMYLHHMVGTDPRLGDFINLQLLDLNNPGDEPNDGIVYSFDQFFHAQDDRFAIRNSDGEPSQPTRTFLPLEHFDISDDDGTGVLAAAALFHTRKVRLTVTEVTVRDDLERDGPFDFSNAGDPPAEVIFETRVRYDPWVSDRVGKEITVHRSTQERRSADMFVAAEDETIFPAYRLYEGPIFDDMEELWIEIDAQETDCYPRFDLNEWCLGSPDRFLRYRGPIELHDHERVFENELIRFTVEVRVETLVH